MTLDILRKTGGWCVELQQPLRSHSGDIAAVEIRAPTADIVIRWTNYEIASMLALLSRLCGLPERLLRELPQSDFDRVMTGFMVAVGPAIRAECEAGKRALATPDDELPEDEHIPVPDQQDPRFPIVPGGGPVVRLAEKKPQPQLPPEDRPIDMSSPPASEVVR